MKIIPLFAKFEYYKSIEEMPIFNWLKVQEKNDLRYVLKKYRDATKGELGQLQVAVQLMKNEYIDTFGISEEYKKLLVLDDQIRILEIEYVTTGDRSKLTMIEYKSRQLKANIKTGVKADSGTVKIYVSKYMGFQVNFKEMSVKEFYSILREVVKEARTKTA